jgi:hypothetical protein
LLQECRFGFPSRQQPAGGEVVPRAHFHVEGGQGFGTKPQAFEPGFVVNVSRDLSRNELFTQPLGGGPVVEGGDREGFHESTYACRAGKQVPPGCRIALRDRPTGFPPKVYWRAR